jgi:hypothetical protein
LRPKGVNDGQQVNIPALCTQGYNCGGNAITNAGSRLVVAIVPEALPGIKDRHKTLRDREGRFKMPEQLELLPRKTSNRTTVHIRTKTDTGRRGEYPKALERTVFKELGNFTPYVCNKGSLPGAILHSRISSF